MAVIGSVIDDKYEILKLIGRGGMSKVYLAMDKRLNKQWAVKEITKNARDKNNEVIVQSAVVEANIVKKLDHPTLPRIVDIIDNGDLIYVIMDYIEGEPLSKVLDEYGAQPQDLVIEWAKQLCQVLHYLHNCNPPIIYRDMKPANVMLKTDGNIKLIDFGIAREFKDKKLSDTVNLGTKGYAAPEQFDGKGQTDARTDIYSLGVTLYHLVTGQSPCDPPYEMYPIRYWNPTLSGGLEQVIQKCTQSNPDDRYQTCEDLLYALNHYEEMDEEYRVKQKSKLRNFILMASLTLISLFVGMFGMFMRAKTNNNDYLNNLQQAEKATDDEEKARYYLSAIDVKPSRHEAYTGLVEAFKSDAKFTTDEEERLMKKINSYLTSLRASPDYADLAFEFGKLYWYYYDYGKGEGNNGDNQITRMKSAIEWLEDAVQYGSSDKDYYQMAVVYRDIGRFNKEINLNIEEASDKGKYGPYFKNIKELLAFVENDPNENEIVRLELYKLAMHSIETYAKKLKADGITETDVRAVYESAKQGLETVSITTEKTEELKLSVTNRFSVIETAITNAYMETEEGENE